MVQIRAPEHAQARPQPDHARTELVSVGRPDVDDRGTVAKQGELARGAAAQAVAVVHNVGTCSN